MRLYTQPRAWRVPGGLAPSLYRDALSQVHLLVGGTTGAGKSTAVNGMISTLLATKAPCEAKLILIDPKRVELCDYADVPHCIRYESEMPGILSALEDALQMINRRYGEMAKRRLKLYDGADVYIIIDELAHLMTRDKRHVQPLLQDICQIARAARVHVIACTQSPLAAVISTPIKVNIDSVLALRTRSAQDSRNLLGKTGCEALPQHGKAYYSTPDGVRLVDVPMIPQDEIDALLDHWTSAACRIA